MELFFTPLHIFIATCAGFAVGMVWYSPVLFLHAWQKVEGATQEKPPKRTLLYAVQTHAYSFIAHGAMTSVLAIIFDLLGVSSLKATVSLGLLLVFGFIITVKFTEMVYTQVGKHYEKNAQIKFLIASGYYLVSVAVISVVLSLLVF